MAQAGTIQEISGSVTAKTYLGEVRELKAGDIVYENELIQTSENASVTVALDNGRIINMSENSQILIDESVTDVIDAQDATARQAVVQEVEEMQQALAEGEDITDAEEETAVGEDDENHDFDLAYHAGDQSSGAVGSYLLPAEGPTATETADELPANPNEEVIPLGTVPTAAADEPPPEVTLGTVPTAVDGSASQSDAALQDQSAATGSLAFDMGDDLPGTVAMTYDGGLGEANQTSADGVTTFTASSWILTIDETTGAYEFSQIGPYTHDPDADSANGQVVVTLTNSDGSTETVTLTLTIGDDVPEIDVSAAANATMVSLTTQDADTIGEADTDAGSFANLFAISSDMGADIGGTQTVSYSLSVTASATGLTSNGEAITVAVTEENVVVGSTINGDIFMISVDASNGFVTLTQYANIDHLPEDVDGVNNNANIGLSEGNVLLTATATITDGDNDSATDSETIDISSAMSFDDDVPTVSGTQNSYLGNEAGNSLTASLGVEYGADQPPTPGGGIVLTSTYDGNDYVDLTDGLPVTDKDGIQLTADGIDLKYAWATNGDLIAVMDPQSVDPNYDVDYVAFRVSVDDTAGTYTVTIEDGVDGASQVVSIGLTGDLQGGNTLIVTKDVNLDDDPNIELRLTATAYIQKEGQIEYVTVNYNNNGMGVGTGSSINGEYNSGELVESDVLRLEFTNPEENGAFIKMNVIQADLWQFGDADTGYWRAISHADGTETVVAEGSFDASDYTATGNQTGYVTINPGVEFDTIEFLGDTDNNGYSISSVSIVNTSEAYDSTLSFSFQATDADGDTASGTFDVTFDGDGNITGTDDGEVIKGTSDGNFIDGGSGADIIYGGSGDDTIVFDADDTSVDGGLGYDTLLVADSGILDFSRVTDMEALHLNAEGEEQNVTLSLDHVLDMTGDGNLTDGVPTLTVTGEDGDDTVTLTGLNNVDGGSWTHVDDSGGLFTNGTDFVMITTTPDGSGTQVNFVDQNGDNIDI